MNDQFPAHDGAFDASAPTLPAARLASTLDRDPE